MCIFLDKKVVKKKRTQENRLRIKAGTHVWRDQTSQMYGKFEGNFNFMVNCFGWWHITASDKSRGEQ